MCIRDRYITDKNTGERILIYDSYVGDDYEIDKINVARFFDVYDDRLVIYSVGLYEGTAGFGIYNIETVSYTHLYVQYRVNFKHTSERIYRKLNLR